MITLNINTKSKQGIYLALFLQELAKTDPSIIEYTGPAEDELLAELMTIKTSESIKKILVIIEKGDDGIFSAYTPETKSTVLNGQGNTEAEAIENMKESYFQVFDSYLKNEDIPDELKQPFEFEYKYK